MLRGIPSVLMRGGSSKGLYFLAANLPSDTLLRDRVLLAAMGSPDLRQIDGLGGGDDLSSKVVIVSPSRRADIDVEYLFAQVSVARKVVDILPNSGNMLAGVGPFAIEQGLVCASATVTAVRILNLNTGKIVIAEVPTPDRVVTYRGDFKLDGVPGTGAPIRLTFIAPDATRTSGLLPTGHPIDEVFGIPVSCVDFANPIVFVAASTLGKSGHESKAELDGDADFLSRIEDIRCAAARLMGLGDVAGKGLPKIAMLAPPRQHGHIASRYFVPATCHAAHAITGALCLAAACCIPGTVAAGLVAVPEGQPQSIVIEHPAGQIRAEIEVTSCQPGKLPLFGRASIVTTARPLLEGEVFIPSHIWPATGEIAKAA